MKTTILILSVLISTYCMGQFGHNTTTDSMKLDNVSRVYYKDTVLLYPQKKQVSLFLKSFKKLIAEYEKSCENDSVDTVYYDVYGTSTPLGRNKGVIYLKTNREPNFKDFINWLKN